MLRLRVIGGQTMDDGNGQTYLNQDQTSLPPNDSTPTPSASTSPTSFGNNPNDQDSQDPPTQNDQNSNTVDTQLPANDNNVPALDDNELLEIKRSALQNLLPIVGKLDQPPEERFQTLLMVIQASDNRDLIKEAYETAANITDDGKRAQALLAIINEVNFFTQPPQN